MLKAYNDTGADTSQNVLIENLGQQLQDANEQIQICEGALPRFYSVWNQLNPTVNSS